MLNEAFIAVAIAACLVAAIHAPALASEKSPDFADFDRRAKAGERLNVVFFGASLTWGANASDPLQTSYRANIARRFEAAYPEARFKFFDGAIGGTGSQLGVFRFDRDALRHKPDLLFLDFSANDDIHNDDPETLASYESLVRRTILDAKAPCVQVIFPFQWNVDAELEKMKRRTAHLAIAKAYNCPVGDAIELAQQRVKSGETALKTIWPFDGVHPGDAGYALFADAAWAAFQKGVNEKMRCVAPETMLHAPTYMTNARVRITSLGDLPVGWRSVSPNLTSAFFDMLMSRWQENQAVASGKSPGILKARFNGSMVLLFGEATMKSGKYRVRIDGKPVTPPAKKDKPPVEEYDAGDFGRRINGNGHHVVVLAKGLDPSADHSLEIEPVFEGDQQELRLESICVAGGKATVVKE